MDEELQTEFTQCLMATVTCELPLTDLDLLIAKAKLPEVTCQVQTCISHLSQGGRWLLIL